MNVTDAIAEHARDRADHPAIEDGDRVITYAQLDRCVDKAADDLLEAGVRQGDFVGTMLPNSADHIVLICALARLGAITVPINSALPRAERDRAFAGLDLNAVVVEPGASPLEGLPPQLSLPEICDVPKRPVGRLTRQWMARSFDGNLPITVDQSSGTTGLPKRLLLTHAQFLSRFRTHVAHTKLTPSERCLLIISLTFYDGRHRCMMMLHRGATVVVTRNLAAKDILASLDEKRITLLYVTPSILRPLVATATGDGPVAPGVRIVVGSSVLYPEERRRTLQHITPALIETYGTNEAGPLTFSMPDDRAAFPDSVGRLVDGIEAQIVDDQDQLLPPNSVGHIRVRGPDLPDAYLDNAEATARHFRDGWFYPGDLASINQGGFVFLKGRSDDAIDNEGAKFYPIEVENALLAHPQVAEAAVCGWPHLLHGEVAIAFAVVRSPVTADELMAFCRTRVASYKVPRVIAFVNELPKNAAGKVLKGRLKEAFRKALAEHLD